MNSSGTEDRLSRAKRILIANTVIFGAALIIIFFVLDDNSSEPPKEKDDTQFQLNRYTPQELAYLKGQMLALSQHPESMPDFDKEWTLRYCASIVASDPQIQRRKNVNADLLTDAFFRGYTKRFNEYYDTRAAHAAGYSYGVRLYPIENLQFGGFDVLYHLESHREELQKRFDISDDATWAIFAIAFEKGFWKGYPIIEPGVTAKDARQKVELIEK